MNFQELYDEQKYGKSLLECLRSFKEGTTPEAIVFLIKNSISMDGFKIKDQGQIKKLTFYYFYLLWKVTFTNDYQFYFKKEILRVNLRFLLSHEWESDFAHYFDLGKNVIFLNKIKDLTATWGPTEFRKWVIEVDDIIDFFIAFTHENLELYSLEWEHFPLFKWVINELSEH